MIYSSTQFYISIVKRITRAVPRSLDRNPTMARIGKFTFRNFYVRASSPFSPPCEIDTISRLSNASNGGLIYRRINVGAHRLRVRIDFRPTKGTKGVAGPLIALRYDL